MNIRKKMTLLFLASVTFGVQAESADCLVKRVRPVGHVAGFAQNKNEPSFAQRYDPSMALPVTEEHFLAVAKKHNLNIELRSQGVNAFCEYPPTQMRVMDDSIRKVYYVSDPSTIRSNPMVIYLAYVDSRGMVVYVESNFTYDGP